MILSEMVDDPIAMARGRGSFSHILLYGDFFTLSPFYFLLIREAERGGDFLNWSVVFLFFLFFSLP